MAYFSKKKCEGNQKTTTIQCRKEGGKHDQLFSLWTIMCAKGWTRHLKHDVERGGCCKGIRVHVTAKSAPTS